MNVNDLRSRLGQLGDPGRFLTNLLAFSPTPIQIYLPNGHSLLVNDAFCSLFGSEPPAAYNVFADDVAERAGMLALIRRAFAGESVHLPAVWYDPREIRHVHVTGRRRVAFEANFVPIFDDAHAVEFVLVLFHDRTNEMIAKEELSELLAREQRARADAENQRERLRTLFEQAPASITVHEGPDLVFVQSNERHQQLTGHRNLIGRPLAEGMPELVGQGVVERLREVYETGEAFTARELLTEVAGDHGTLHRRAFDVVWQPLRASDGRVDGVMTFSYDVTEHVVARERAEKLAAELAASEERFRVVQESSPDGFMVFKSVRNNAASIEDFEWVYVNLAAEKIVGRSHQSLMGQRLLVEMPGNRETGLFDAYVAVVETGEVFRREFSYAFEGLQHWFRALAVRLADGFAVTFEDVSDRKRADLERTELLAAAHAAREDAERHAQQAETANRLKDEFLATVSHELRTPLQSILGWARILRDKGRLDAERLDKGIEIIDRNARVQAQLIEDILDVSRIIAGKLRLSVQPVTVQSFVEAAADTIRTAAEAKRIELLVDVAPSAGEVLGDPDRLQQIVWNLVANAVKFTPARGRVTVRARRCEDSILIEVEDTGKGIEEGFLPHVFERFRQADASTTRASGGLGLGLAIVRHLVELHGGRAFVASQGLHRGSTFSVRLPAQTDFASSEPSGHPRPEENPGSPAARELAGRRILVVDDEPDARELVAVVLGEAGAVVQMADSTEEAMSCLHEFRPELLLSDIAMPVEDGYSLIRRVRALADDELQNIPAVALTAYARIDDRQRALAAGFNDHVVKPAAPDALIAVVARCLHS